LRSPVFLRIIKENLRYLFFFLYKSVSITDNNKKPNITSGYENTSKAHFHYCKIGSFDPEL